MRSIESTLSSVHKIAGEAQGEIARALAAKRGVSRAKLREWASWYEQAARDLVALEVSLPARQETRDED